MKGSYRDGVRLGAGYASVVGSEVNQDSLLTNNNFNLVITNTASAPSTGLVRVTYQPGYWTPNPRDRVLISGVQGTTEANGTWIVSPVSGQNQFDLLGSSYTHAFVASGVPTVILRGDGIRIMPGASSIKIAANRIEPENSGTNSLDYGVFNDGAVAASVTPLAITGFQSGGAYAGYPGTGSSSTLLQVALTSVAGGWFPITGDLVTVTSHDAYANGTWAVTNVTSTTVDLQYSIYLSSHTYDTSGSPTLAPATQTDVSVENNALTGNAIGPYFSNIASNTAVNAANNIFYKGNIRFRDSGGVEQSDVSYTAPVATATASTPTLLAYISGKKVLITRLTATQSGGGSTCGVYPLVNGTQSAGNVIVSATGTTSTLYSSPFLVDGTTTPAALQYKFANCTGTPTATVQFDGINVD